MFINNFYQKARNWRMSVIWALWDACLKQFVKSKKVFWQITRGFSTTISDFAQYHHPKIIDKSCDEYQSTANSRDLTIWDFFLFNVVKKPLRIFAAKRRKLKNGNGSDWNNKFLSSIIWLKDIKFSVSNEMSHQRTRSSKLHLLALSPRFWVR